MGESPALKKPKITWMNFQDGKKRKIKSRQKFHNQARFMNALMEEEDVDKALEISEISVRSLKRYFKEESFQVVLDRIAPFLSAKVLCNVLEIADGGPGKDVNLKANLELLKEFAPRATNNQYTFDGGVRKAREEGTQERGTATFKDMVRAMARDQFVDYSKEIKLLQEEDSSPQVHNIISAGEVAEAEIIIEKWEEELE